MPQFKKHTFSARNEAGATEQFTESISVDADGNFYCYVPDHLADILRQETKKNNRIWMDHYRGKTKYCSKGFEWLISAINNALSLYIKPEIIDEIVILYNIESHVSFAEKSDGTIYPNASDGAEWVSMGKDDIYGGHHATRPSNGGYSLTVGAIAKHKRTYRYGELEKVKYEMYYGKGDHLSIECPASLLNSWCSFTLGRDPKEIPYSDEAAMFFHNLMLNMAEMCRKIQHFTQDKDVLLSLIHSGQKLLQG